MILAVVAALSVASTAYVTALATRGRPPAGSLELIRVDSAAERGWVDCGCSKEDYLLLMSFSDGKKPQLACDVCTLWGYQNHGMEGRR
jgi:hypothetical protein